MSPAKVLYDLAKTILRASQHLLHMENSVTASFPFTIINVALTCLVSGMHSAAAVLLGIMPDRSSTCLHFIPAIRSLHQIILDWLLLYNNVKLLHKPAEIGAER